MRINGKIFSHPVSSTANIPPRSAGLCRKREAVRNRIRLPRPLRPPLVKGKHSPFRSRCEGICLRQRSCRRSKVHTGTVVRRTGAQPSPMFPRRIKLRRITLMLILVIVLFCSACSTSLQLDTTEKSKQPIWRTKTCLFKRLKYS